MMGQPLWKRIKSRFGQSDQGDALVISRHNHKVSRKLISENALKVLYRLNKSGYEAYLVGGSVRDLLLKRRPKDFDIVTDAHPEAVRKIFRNSRLIGRRFRLVHVYYPDEIIEVSTFRANTDENACKGDADDMPTTMIKADNTYGTIEEDAWRRDFTINALYYNIKNFSVVDYTGGMIDLKKQLIRMIGDPVQRYHEDPVRLLRAMRLSAKCGLKIAEETEAPLFKLSNLLWHVAPARLFDEILKLFFEGNAEASYKVLLHYGYMRVLFPATYHSIKKRDNNCDTKLIQLAVKATDLRFQQGLSLNPGFLMAILLWPAIQNEFEADWAKELRWHQVVPEAIDSVLAKQLETVSIPKRLTAMMRSVWLLQYHLLGRRGRRVYRCLSHRYFRAAYDFLELRVQSGEPFKDEYEWWKRFQKVSVQERAQMVKKLNPGRG